MSAKASKHWTLEPSVSVKIGTGPVSESQRTTGPVSESQRTTGPVSESQRTFGPVSESQLMTGLVSLQRNLFA